MRTFLAALVAAPLLLVSAVAFADGEVTTRVETDVLNPSGEVTGLFGRLRRADTANGVRLEVVVVRPTSFGLVAANPAQLSPAAANSLIAELVRSFRREFAAEPVIPAPGS